MSSISKTWCKLSDPEYRKAFVASQINIGIPFQIRALAEARGWSQEQVADRCGMSQPRISELMRPGRTKPNLGTLLRIAAGFDCGLLVRFVRFSELALWSERFDPEAFDAAPFSEDSLPIESRLPEEHAEGRLGAEDEGLFEHESHVSSALSEGGSQISVEPYCNFGRKARLGALSQQSRVCDRQEHPGIMPLGTTSSVHHASANDLRRPAA